MFKITNTELAPWKVIKANRKTKERIEAIEHRLETITYDDKNIEIINPVASDD